jgi:hypothetical protein
MHGFEGREMEGLVKSDIGSATDKKASRFLEVNDTLMLRVVDSGEFPEDIQSPCAVLVREVREYGEPRLDCLHPGQRPVRLSDDDAGGFGCATIEGEIDAAN